MYGFQKRSDRPQPQKLADGGEAQGFGFKTRAQRALEEANKPSAPGMGFIPDYERSSGPVRGPGTGTSDSVKTAVPEGTYVMPADSTQQIGEQNLAALGFRPGMNPADRPKPSGPGLGFGPGSRGAAILEADKARRANEPELRLGFKSRAQREREQAEQANAVPVHLSNGEFQVSPEQVRAIGVEVLNQLKDATHTPVPEPQRATDELYFANGTPGVVEDPNKRPLATSPSNTYPGNQAERAGNIYGPSNASITQGAKSTANYLNNGDPVKDAAGAVGDFFSRSAEQARQPNTWDDSGTRLQVPDAPAAKPATPVATPPTAPAVQTQATLAGKTPDAPSATPPAAASPAPSPTATTPPANNITREGNSYSGQNVGAGATINGKSPEGGFVASPPRPRARLPARLHAERSGARGCPGPGLRAW